jgi:hypothetical protein
MPNSFRIMNTLLIGLMLIILAAALGCSFFMGISYKELERYIWLNYLYQAGILLLLLIPIFNLIYLSLYFFRIKEKNMIWWGLTLIIILSLGTLLVNSIK